MYLDDNQFFYVHKCKSTKKMWNTVEMIYEVSPSVEQERMNTRGEEDDCFIHKFLSKFKNVRKKC